MHHFVFSSRFPSAPTKLSTAFPTCLFDAFFCMHGISTMPFSVRMGTGASMPHSVLLSFPFSVHMGTGASMPHCALVSMPFFCTHGYWCVDAQFCISLDAFSCMQSEDFCISHLKNTKPPCSYNANNIQSLAGDINCE